MEPFETGMLDVGDGQRLFFALSGNPKGRPVVVLHGGPGSGMSRSIRDCFDASDWLIVQFDQRGAGQSTPHASAPEIDLSVNTTDHLIGDIESLRRALGIERWTVAGGSWGATLAQAYIARHRPQVTAALLYLVTMTTRREIAWFAEGAGRFFPDAFIRFAEAVPEATDATARVRGYHRLLMDPTTADATARRWCDWEMALVSGESGGKPDPRYDDPAFRLGFARLVTHYFGHHGFLPDGALLAAARMNGAIPARLIHGALDISAPLETAHALHRAWPESRLATIGGAGHNAGTATMRDAIAAAAADLARDC
ncbi:alpha/beta fold hydrolase [Martelella endophytica]|nr:alpha/beta fold hydrolase [Martelella endophytica]